MKTLILLCFLLTGCTAHTINSNVNIGICVKALGEGLLVVNIILYLTKLHSGGLVSIILAAHNKQLVLFVLEKYVSTP